MDAISQVCFDQWKTCDGSGLTIVNDGAVTRSDFMRELNNDYTMHLALPFEVKSYVLVASGVTVDMHVSANKRPSAVTVKLLKACLASLSVLFGRPRSNRLRLFLIQRDEHKLLIAPLTKRKINTGFYHRNTIVVYRCQEMHKVLVHEMLHFWGTHDDAVDPFAQSVVSRLGAPPDCVLFEGYVETLATIMMCGFCAKSGTPQERLRKEIAQAYVTAKAVVSIEQSDTNVWAYYVARACLFACKAETSKWLQSTKHVKKLQGPVAWKSFVQIIDKGMTRMGGPRLSKLPEPKKTLILRSCDCDLGPSFAQT